MFTVYLKQSWMVNLQQTLTISNHATTEFRLFSQPHDFFKNFITTFQLMLILLVKEMSSSFSTKY